MAVYVLSPPQPITDNAPPSAPKLPMAEGIDKTPVAKMTGNASVYKREDIKVPYP